MGVRGHVVGPVRVARQLLLFKDGKPVFDRDNWDITAEAVAEGLQDNFTRVA